MPAQAHDAVPRSPLLERDRELAALSQAIADARDGSASAVLVRSVAGLGKTRLLGAAAELAADAGLTVLRASGNVLERDFPFGVVLRLLEPPLRDASDVERTRLSGGSAALAAPMLLGDQLVEQALESGSEASLLHALQRFVSNLGRERPLALIIDDLHWADPASIRLLILLAARIDELGVLLIAALRPRDPDGPAELLAQLTATDHVRVLEPRSLSERASAQLIDGLADPTDAFVHACFQETGGNPLLLRELLRALAADGVAGTDADVERVRAIGPSSVAHDVAATLGRLAPECAALATAVAVLVGNAELGMAARLAGLDDATAARAAADLQDAGLFEYDAALSFRHPLLRRAVYERPAPAARAALHREAARRLLDRAPAHDVASHLMLAHGAGESWAVEVLRAAARNASALAGHAAAARLLRRALSEPPEPADRPVVLQEAAFAAARAGAQDAVPALRNAIEAVTDGRDHARLALALARTHYQRGEMSESVKAAQDGLRSLGATDGDESLALELEAAMNISALWTPIGRKLVAARYAATGEDDAPARTQGERELFAGLAGLGVLRGEDRERVLRFARRAWDDGVYLRDAVSDAAATGGIVTALLRSGAPDEALVVASALVEDARHRASPFAYATSRSGRGNCLLYLGRLAEARSDLEEALEARALGWDATAPLAVEALVSVLLEQDRLDAAGELLDTADTLADKFAGGPWWASLLEARGRFALARGDAQAALDHFLAAGRVARNVLGTDNPALSSWRSGAALAERQLGQVDAAATYAAQEVAHARHYGAPRALSIALNAQAIVTGGAHGLALAAEAAQLATDGRAPLQRARALGTSGALLRASRRNVEARQRLRQALDLADEHGMHLLVRGLREELVAAGGRPRRMRTQGPSSLTAGERRTARLAADGLTNRQIADALFVTPKAVGFHLGNTYRKLGIQGRRDLADALRGVR